MARWTTMPLLCLSMVVCTFDGWSAVGAEDTPLWERTGPAIDRGVEWLRKQQDENGSWGDTSNPDAKSYDGSEAPYEFPVGPTAFALYTLLKCQVPRDDPGIERGFEWLRSKGNDLSTYELSAMILAIEARYDQVKREHKREAAAALEVAPGKRPNLRVKLPKADAAWMKKLMGALEDRFDEGGWRYFRPNSTQRWGAPRDTSATAMSMLAILAAHRCGVDVPRKLVVAVVSWTLDQQDADGPAAAESARSAGAGQTSAPTEVRARGWAYVRRSPIESEPTTTNGNMTTAALISLLCAQHVLQDTGESALAKLQPKIDTAVADGIAWLDAHWTVAENPPKAPHYHYMYLYGLERVGDLRRTPLIAGHDWYTEGATLLLDQQRDNGCWYKTDTHPPFGVLNTCFALLFLDRASLVVEVTPR